VAAAGGNDALTAGLAAGGAEAAAPALSKWLYGTDDPEKLTAQQKATVGTIAGLAGNALGGVAGSTPADAVAAGMAAENAAENNQLRRPPRTPIRVGRGTVYVNQIEAMRLDFLRAEAQGLRHQIEEKGGSVPAFVSNSNPTTFEEVATGYRNEIAALQQVLGGLEARPAVTRPTFSTTKPVEISGSRAIDLGYSYEAAVRDMYNTSPQTYRTTMNGQTVTGVADGVTYIAGRRTAVEAKFVENWSTSLRNPASPIGDAPWSINEQITMMNQALRYSSNFPGGVVYHTNSAAFATYYSQVFRDAGITNVRFVITPAKY
jgi:hypothetical protein